MADILWVEDQTHWIDRFRPTLEAEAFDQRPTRLTVFRFAAAACQHIRQPGSAPPDLVLLDAQMSGDDEAGFSVFRALRKRWPEVPVIYLSEYSGTGIEEQAFEQTEARDFIAKHQPNIEQVLCWRIRAALRQSQQPGEQSQLQQGPLRIDTETWEIWWNGSKLMNPANPQRPLGPTPRKILRYLVEASPRPLTTDQIAAHLQADPDRFSWASYRQHIRTLRHSLDQAAGGNGRFMTLCQQGEGLVTFGDEGAYCWRPVSPQQEDTQG
ncbi:MAG: response regulator [Natronospirillum sp.]|uniref:response regulator transcription factor n=1 Tax=Natronospirillum sp. TaxID=2812955 RepID=UPI0025E70A8F|nr:response regulator [Natronospirillum sp.]MCH8551210.1 response regulator [Natronospirillum sp.]